MALEAWTWIQISRSFNLYSTMGKGLNFPGFGPSCESLCKLSLNFLNGNE